VASPAIELVDAHATLRVACDALDAAERLYLDTEFEASREGTRLCLIQVSRGETIYLVDALRLSALKPLAAVLSRRQVEWVLHAAAQDVPLLLNELRLTEPPSLFDTQVAWALLSPEYSVSLAYLKYRLLGLRSGKTHQADDWKRRPLPPSQLEYAASDIEHLPAVFAELEEQARRRRREQLVRAASRELAWPQPEPPSVLELGSFRNAWQLDPHSQAGLRFIIDWHNGLDTRARAKAPEPKTLLSIASRMPESASELARIKGVGKRWCAQHGEQFTAQLMRASHQANREDFVPIDPPPYATFEQIRLEAWLGLVRAELCAELMVSPELALPQRIMRRALRAIARTGDPGALLGQLHGWRRQLLAEAYEAVVKQHPPPVG
jgi:ribonuclease D